MPRYTTIDGERCRSFTEEARWAELAERDLFRSLLSVQSEAELIVEFIHDAAREGDEVTIDPDTRKQISDTCEALTNLNAALPKPKWELVK